MLIKVTQQDIELGMRFSSLRCPVACAIKRAADAAVAVGATSVIIYDQRLPLPAVAELAIRDFDAGRVILPFEFELDV